MELLILGGLIFGIIGAAIGSRKNSGCAGALLGLLLGPIGLIIALCMRGDRKPCQHCKELVFSGATVCKHCGKDPRGTSSRPTPARRMRRATGKRIRIRKKPQAD